MSIWLVYGEDMKGHGADGAFYSKAKAIDYIKSNMEAGQLLTEVHKDWIYEISTPTPDGMTSDEEEEWESDHNTEYMLQEIEVSK